MKHSVIVATTFIHVIFQFSRLGYASIHDQPRQALDKDPNKIVSEEEFSKTVQDVVDVYKPYALKLGAELKPILIWDDPRPLASARRNGYQWLIYFNGGMARDQYITKDGFVMVVCHELAHHFGGFPFKRLSWATNEGQADYYAAQTCLPLIWAEDQEGNAKARTFVHSVPKKECDSIWESEERQNLCYRIAMAGKSMAEMLDAMNDFKVTIDFDTPTTNKVQLWTKNIHPSNQCRLDTFLAGALCTVDGDLNVIPGYHQGKVSNSKDAELESYRYSCSRRDGFEKSARPLCWYKPRVQ